MMYYQCEFTKGGKRYTYHAADGYEPAPMTQAATESGDCVMVIDVAEKPSFPTKALVGDFVSPIGHNSPPSEIEIVQGRLAEAAIPINAALDNLPEPPESIGIDEPERAGKLTAHIKDLTGLRKDTEAKHAEIKKPYLECGRVVDGWKTDTLAQIDAKRKALEKPLADYLRRKEAAEQARLMAEQERLRQEAAAKAEQARIEAEALLAEAADSEQSGLSETSQELLNEAQQLETTADMIMNHAINAKPADLAKARSAHGGASASQKLVWEGVIEHIEAIDLETLRPYLAQADIEKAMRAFIKAGGRTLRGAKIYQSTKLNVR